MHNVSSSIVADGPGAVLQRGLASKLALLHVPESERRTSGRLVVQVTDARSGLSSSTACPIRVLERHDGLPMIYIDMPKANASYLLPLGIWPQKDLWEVGATGCGAWCAESQLHPAARAAGGPCAPHALPGAPLSQRGALAADLQQPSPGGGVATRGDHVQPLDRSLVALRPSRSVGRERGGCQRDSGAPPRLDGKGS